MFRAIDIAFWFLAKNDLNQDFNSQDYAGISNMKIQKMLYFAQGISVAFTGKKLFSDKLYAWDHGPVVPNVYFAFKDYGPNSINAKEMKNDYQRLLEIDSDKETRELLTDIFDSLNNYSANVLRRISHDSNGPWARVYNPNSKELIPIDDFFVKYFQSIFSVS